MIPFFAALAKALAKLFVNYFQPRSSTAGMVEWRKREFNTVPDYLCNFSMDTGTEVFEVRRGVLLKTLDASFNLQIYIDGGFRFHTLAAGAWCLFSCEMQGPSCKFTMLARRSFLLTACQSSFEAEVLALEVALSYSTQLLLQEGSVGMPTTLTV